MSPRRVDRGRLADDAVVDRLAALAQGLGDGDRAVDGVAFLIGSEQEGDRAAVLGPGGDEGFGGGDESGQRSLHVGGAAPVQHALLAQRLEGVAVPLFERAAGDDVGVAGQTEQRAAAAAARPEVADRAALDELAAEADGFQAAGDDRQATGVVGGQRATGDELLGELASVASLATAGLLSLAISRSPCSLRGLGLLVSIVETEGELLEGSAAGVAFRQLVDRRAQLVVATRLPALLRSC
jgi:hypothetical protein